MEKRISWSEPLITLEIPSSFPAVRNIPLPKEGLSSGKKSMNNNLYFKFEPKNSANRSNFSENTTFNSYKKSILLIIIILCGLLIFFKYKKII